MNNIFTYFEVNDQGIGLVASLFLEKSKTLINVNEVHKEVRIIKTT